MSFAQVTQVVVFSIFCLEFIAFSFGLIHVPTNLEDQKFFYMIFGIMNTILSVQALTYKIQKDDGYITPVQKQDTSSPNDQAAE
jgi:hypothetical protein